MKSTTAPHATASLAIRPSTWATLCSGHRISSRSGADRLIGAQAVRRMAAAVLAAVLMTVVSTSWAVTVPRVFRCLTAASNSGPSAVSFSDQPCPTGQRLQPLVATQPTAAQRAQARDLAQREAQWADQMRRERLAREAVDRRIQDQRSREGVTGVRMPSTPFADARPDKPRKLHTQAKTERWVPVRQVQAPALSGRSGSTSR